jgi:hypothetical protein
MVITRGDGETWATFFDELTKAEEYRSTGDCCLGYYAEVYERMETECGSEYVFIYA